MSHFISLQSRQSVQEMLQKSRELSQKRTNPDASGDSSDDDLQLVADDTTEVIHSSQTTEQNPWMDTKVKANKPAVYKSPESVVNNKLNSRNVLQDTIKHDIAKVSTIQEARKEDEKHAESSPEEDSEPNEDIEEIFSAVGKKPGKQNTPGKTKKSWNSRTKKKRKARKESECSDNKSKQTVVHDLSNYDQPDNDEDLIRMSLTRRMAKEDFEGELTDDEVEVTHSKALKKIEPLKLASENKEKQVTVNVDPKKFFTVEKTLLRSKAPDLVTNDSEEGIIEQEEQRMTIAQAFASDDVIEEFRQEKKSTEERDKPKDIDLTLPGWGSWAGAGLVPSKRKKNR